MTFVAAPDFEAPTDAGGNNVYDLQVTASDGTNNTVQNIAVTVSDVGPTVITSAATANFAENASGPPPGPPPLRGTVTYSISGGADAAKFAINSTTGVLTFVAAPDFETPTDPPPTGPGPPGLGGGGPASTASSGTAVQSLAVTVTAVNDNDPVITTATTVNFAENATGTVIDVNATDADLPAQTLTFPGVGRPGAPRFAINATTGVVTFVSSPNFELPTDVGADNVYDLTVTASDGTRTVNQAIAVTVTAVNEFSPVFTSAASANFAENGTGTIVTVQATDADLPAATLTYSISGGVDAAKFAIDSATGALTFVSAPNFEAPTDSGANNIYNVQVTASDGTRSTNQALAITVTAVNDNDPVITTAAAANFAENATGTVIDVNATDADLPAQTLTFSITGGADAAKFAINATTGVVTFVSSPNFESPTDVGANNVYDLTVTASDGTRTVNQAIAVTVTAVNEFSPVFTSAASANFAENGAGTVVTVQATDADLPTPTLSYSISGGVDAAKFAINATTGALTFVSSPNFEAPTDSGANNVYNVQVTASDGTNSTNQALAVTVTGVNDATPVITTAATANFAENGSGTVIDVNATDADLPAQTLTFSITGGADAALFAINATTGVVTFVSSPDFESPTDAGANNVYDLQVTASDGTLSVAQAIAVTVTAVNDNTPVMTSSATANFAENATGTVLTVQASDADLPGQTLSYSITGGVDAAKFAINATTGALTFVTSPNFEAPTDSGANNVYNVQVTASDGTNSVNQAVAITVTAVNDNSPLFTSSTTASFAENGTGTVIDVNATDADLPGDTLTFSISGGADAALFAIDSATGALTFVTAPDFEAPTDAGANNVYNVQVTASDGVNSTNQGIAITVTDIGPTVISSAATANFAENGAGTVLDVDAASEGVITYSISGGADAAKFAIDAATGVLTFVAAPDFETPTDVGANNVYDVQVTAATASSGTTSQNIAITVTALNDNDPVITTAATVNFAENATGTVIDVNATDADLPAQTLTFSITGGADAAKFAINATTGVVTFVSSPNFEAPTDVGADNVYDLTVTASDGTRTVNQAIAVTVTAVNEFSPVFTSAASANFAENGAGTVVTVQATDADLPAGALTYSISGGVDAAKFAIDSATGALTFVSSPNFEAPTDSGANNIYNVQVTASDGTRSTNQALAITVTAVNDNDPVITTAATANFAENATGTVIDVNATDADLPAQTLTFSITGGADAAKFAINATTGVVTFVSSPNFESPTDVGADNVYDLTVTASDGTRTVNQAIAVTVTAVNEFSPVFTSAATASVAENTSGTVLTVQASDADLPGATLVYGIAVGGDGAKFSINSSTGALSFVLSPNFESPADAGANNVYDLTVTAFDGTFTSTQVLAITVTAVNEFNPVFTSASSVGFVENGTGTVVDVNATDADLPTATLTFSITGGADAAKFAINARTGVVTFVCVPDFEAPSDVGGDNVYNLQVTASDGVRTSAQSIAVTVAQVNEFAPVFSSSATVNVAENVTGTVLTVQATDADLPAPTLTYSISGGVDAARFSINASTGALSFVSSPDFEAPTDSGANNVYDVQVTASDGARSTNQAIAVTVTAVNDNLPLITSAATVNFAENGIGTVVDVNATDADLPAQTLTYAISGGVDQASFAIDSATGVLTFVAPPDFEAPTDSNADNVYVVDVAVSDGGNLVTQTITVTVTDASTTAISSAATANFAENGVGTVIDVDASAETPVTYAISGGADAARFSIDAGTGVVTFVASPDFEVPLDADANNIYVFDVTANGGVSGSQVQTVTVTVTGIDDNAPVITSSATANFAENGTGTVIDVNATDADLPTLPLTYSISGGADAAKFAINASTGVVTFVAAPDFESPTDSNADNVYVLQVTASDGSLSSAQTINVTVTNVNDPPVLDTSASPALASINAGSGTPSGAVGTAVSSLVDLSGGAGLNNVTDADSAAIGLALTAVNASNGTWWFSLNNGGSWSTVGAVSDTSALLLSASTGRVYFQPNAGFSGTIANAITFRAWDTSSGTAGAKVTTAGAGTGTSAFSAASDTASEVVAPVASVVDTIVISTLNGTAGLKLNGVRGSLSPGFSDSAGNSVSAAGDVNGDGRADLIVGANAAELLTDSQALNRGRAYVIFGDTSANLATLANGTTGFNLNLLNGTQGAALTGASEVNGGFSYMLAGGGDHNGDGLADLLSSQQNGSGANSRGYVIYGDTATNGTGAGSFGNLNNLVASQLAGSNTSGVNDVNGDGVDDGAVFDGLDGRSLGLAIGNARDVDNDGVDDILIGNAERDTARGTDSGETFLVFGNSSSGLDGLAALGGANGTNVLSFRGQAAADNAGLEVTGIGDIDHDGFDDFLMGATKTGTDGKFYVVLGDTRANLASLSSSVNASGFNTALNGANGFRSTNTPFAAVVNADAGHHVSAVGDFNGDLIDDFVVSVDGVGMALVVFGKSTGFSATLDLTTLMTTHVGGFGIAAGVNDVAGAGDVNGDGLADLIIGNAAANQAYILFGTSNVAPMIRTVEAYGVDLVDLTDNLSLSGSGVNLQSGGYLHGKGVVLNGVASTNFGTSVSGVGDFNGDGFDDVMVGAPLASATTAIGNPAGAAFVVYGADFAQAGTAAVNSTATAASQVLRGAAGVDHLSSGGFANVGISAGNGNDVIRVHGNEFGVNGGGGVDMLTPDTNNLSLNFDALVNKNLYANIEQIQLDGFGTNSVQLDLRDVLDMNGIQSELLITGDNGVDSVLSTGQGWSLSGTTVRNVFIDSTSSSANLTFNVYSHAGMHGSLLVEQGLTQTIT
ncbi:MAG: cadherin domain-containing protein [Proteobacteria bacterium]|nr:cadherin domain-containing protein [Pseudomonadota bacterium]